MDDYSSSHREAYDRAMAEAAATYGDVLAALRQAGSSVAQISQTGGMCLAIEIDFGGSRTVLVTDKNEILPWNRMATRDTDLRTVASPTHARQPASGRRSTCRRQSAPIF